MGSPRAAWAGDTGPRSDAGTALLYLNLERRRIAPRARTVQVAASLQCPNGVEAGYRAVLEKACAGGDLNPHLSRSIGSDAGMHDQLLNDWGMHHLHLGLVPEADGSMKRTGELLFVIVHPTEIFFVAVGRHQEWTSRRLIDAVNADWPHLLDGCRVPLYGPPASEWSEAAHLQMRKSNVLAVSALSTGEPILAPGGGYASSGHSVAVLRRLIDILDQTAQLEARFQTLAPTILDHLAARESAALPDFHLEPIANGGYAAVDVRNAILATLYDPDLPP